MEKLPEYCARHRVEIGILTVPSECAQEVAELLVSCGVKAIWCFAATRLAVPEQVMVCYENLALSLAHLRQKMKISGISNGGIEVAIGQNHCRPE